MECEWRFNNPKPQAQLRQIKQSVKSMVIKRIFMLFIAAPVPFLDTNPFYKEVKFNEKLIEIYDEKGRHPHTRGSCRLGNEGLCVRRPCCQVN